MKTSEAMRSVERHARKRRRMRLINPAFQWKYTVTAVAGAFCVNTLMSVLLFGILHQQARARVINPQMTQTWENATVMLVAALVFSGILAVVLAIWSFVMTHRVCGPLFVMERYLSEVAAGRYPKQRPLRDKDEFKEYYAEFWNALDTIKAREERHLSAMTRALDLARAAPRDGDENRSHDLQSLETEIKALCADINDALAKDDGRHSDVSQEAGADSKPQHSVLG